VCLDLLGKSLPRLSEFRIAETTTRWILGRAAGQRRLSTSELSKKIPPANLTTHKHKNVHFDQCSKLAQTRYDVECKVTLVKGLLRTR
jgi:hypothetical protein